jgi:DNA-binding transcriptional LysR family regulator
LTPTTSGAIYAWELWKDGKVKPVRVEGQVIFNGAYQMLQAAIDGHGLAFMSEDAIQTHLQAGRLCPVMEDHWPLWPGLHAYYPSRRESSRALKLVINALRTSTDVTPL